MRHSENRIFIFVITLVLSGFAFQFVPAQQNQTDSYIRSSAPEVLTYEDCVELLRVDPPVGKLAEKLHQVVTTPFISNEAYYHGVRPPERIRPELGPYLRVGVWNIERGMRLDEIILALKDPAGFQKYMEENDTK